MNNPVHEIPFQPEMCCDNCKQLRPSDQMRSLKVLFQNEVTLQDNGDLYFCEECIGSLEESDLKRGLAIRQAQERIRTLKGKLMSESN